MASVQKMIGLLLFICFVFLSASLSSADSGNQKVQKIITELGQRVATERNLPGLSIAVLRKGDREPVTAAFGVACVENSSLMTAEQKFKIGSITKVFTAALIYKLVEDRALGFETTIDHFFPEFPLGKMITIRNLLNHTSGIVEMLSLLPVSTNMTKQWSPAELIAMAGAEPLSFPPGTEQKYSNTGYLMLAVISEIVTGKSYDQQIKEVFCEKLGMKSLSAGQDFVVVQHMACGYSKSADVGLRLPMLASLAVAKGTGNLIVAPQDVVRLVNLGDVLENNFFDTLELAPSKLTNGHLTTFVRKSENYSYTGSFLDGCTLFVFDEPSVTLLGKIGSFPGFSSTFFYDRKTGFAVAISVNNETSIPGAIMLGAKILHELRQ